MAISINRPGHRVIDVSRWGPTFQKRTSTFFKHPRHLLPGIQLQEAIKNSFKRRIIKWKLILSFFLA